MLDAADDTTATGAVVTGATLADTAGALPTGDAVFGDDAALDDENVDLHAVLVGLLQEAGQHALLRRP